jgi:hypothetical protein
MPTVFTGTVFYFAAESEEELSLWMDCITLATFKQDFSKMGQESEGNLFLCIFLKKGSVKSEHYHQHHISQKCLTFWHQSFTFNTNKSPT